MYLRLSPYREVLQGVLTSLQVNEGIIKITGKNGSGKTALCSQLFHDLERSAQPAVFFLKPPASAIALQNDILDNLKLDPTGNFTRTLTAYLLAHTTADKPLVLIFDDAQQLDPATFSAIRMLCNIQDASRALVRVVICGTEELDEKLASPALRAVTQFLNQSFTLPYLTQEQVNDFCQGFWLAANQDMKPLGERSLQKLFQDTRGHPGILHARLKQGTTGAEKNERHLSGEAAVAPPKPMKYGGRRQGWIPALLTLTGLLVLGGAGAYYFVFRPVDTVTATSAASSESMQRPAAGTAETAPPPAAVPPVAEPPAPQVAAVDAVPAAPATLDATEALDAATNETATDETATDETPTDVTATAAPDPVSALETELDAPAQAATAEPPAAAAVPPAVTEEPAVSAAAAELETPEVSAAPAVNEQPPEPSLPPVEGFIAEWTASWQQQDVDGYLAHYHPDFVPAQGTSQEAWREQRRRVIGNASGIVITTDAPEALEETADGGRLVRFWLNYSAAGYADRTLKELLLAPVDGAWRIRAETNLRTERL